MIRINEKDFAEIVGVEVQREFSFIKPVLWEGDIASGDQFINSDEKRNELISLLPEVLCVEMEGAAVAQVCQEFGMPFTVIRIISDRANHDARVDFGRFTKAVANRKVNKSSNRLFLSHFSLDGKVCKRSSRR